MMSYQAVKVSIIFCLITLAACGKTPSAPSENTLKPVASNQERADAQPAGSANQVASYKEPVLLCDLEDKTINESSGIVASRLNPGMFWTHNDSGDGPFLYGLDRNCKRRGVWRVTGAKARDWEDIAMGPGPEPGRPYLYIGDIGDNGKSRAEIVVYRVAEPAIVENDASTKSRPQNTEPAQAIRLRYPDGSHDAETLLVHPMTGDLYIVTKILGAPAGIYKLAAPISASKPNTLVRVGEVSAPAFLGGLFTGGDCAPDGRRVVLCDYLGGYEITLPDDDGKGFDEVWKQPLTPINLGKRRQGESICYSSDGKALLATSEGVPCPLIEIERQSSAR